MATLSGIRKHQRLLSSVSLVAFTAMWAGTSLANPTGGTVVAGQATISAPDPSTLIVNQGSDKAIINWDNFGINAGETTRFQQPDTQSVTLNRDFSGDPSQIMGSLEANGRVFLINRSGVLFGRNSRVDTAGLVASTHDITDDNFLGGNYLFDQQGEAGASVVNLGNITIADQGLAAFVGPSVRNDGAIVARLGTVELASANGFTLDFNGDQQLTLFVENPVDQVGYTIDGERIENLVENQGRIEADGGLVVLSAVAARGVVNDVINHDGVIQANSVGVRNGKIILSGGDEGVVRVYGSVSATGGDRGETGGHIEITGDKVGLFDGADVDASGHSGGGTALVGGDYQGRGDTPTADFTYVAANARVSADAQETGDGGKAIVWADDTTRAYGTVTATGGAQAGDGGFIEVSGKASLDIAGLQVDASAANGSGGEVLFDPGDIHIVARNDPRITQTPTSVFGPQASASYISSYDIGEYLSQGTDVTIRATLEGPGVDSRGQVYVETSIQPIIRGDGEATLSLFAADQVTVSENVDIGAINTRRFSGKLNIYVDADYDRHGVGVFTLPGNSSIYTNGGFVNLNGSSINTLGEINTEDLAGNIGVVREAHDFFEHTDFSNIQTGYFEPPSVEPPSFSRSYNGYNINSNDPVYYLSDGSPNSFWISQAYNEIVENEGYPIADEFLNNLDIDNDIYNDIQSNFVVLGEIDGNATPVTAPWEFIGIKGAYVAIRSSGRFIASRIGSKVVLKPTKKGGLVYKKGKLDIHFGRNPNQVSHTFRHIKKETGLSESQIAAQIMKGLGRTKLKEGDNVKYIYIAGRIALVNIHRRGKDLIDVGKIHFLKNK